MHKLHLLETLNNLRYIKILFLLKNLILEMLKNQTSGQHKNLILEMLKHHLHINTGLRQHTETL